MNTLTVSLPVDDPQSSALHRTLLASVPSRLRVSNNGPADIRVVSGREPGWVAQAKAAVAEGVRCVVLTRPRIVDVQLLRQLAAHAAEAGSVVAVDTPYASDHTWTTALADLAEAAAKASILDSVVTVAASDHVADALSDALLDQVAVIRPLLGAASVRTVAHRAASHYSIAGQRGATAITLSGVVSPVSDVGLKTIR